MEALALRKFDNVCYVSDQTVLRCCRERKMALLFKSWVHMLYTTKVCTVTHRTDLAVEVLSELDMVSSIEKLLKKLHSYFTKSPKRHLELEKLSELMVSKGGICDPGPVGGTKGESETRC
jgi:hypothetical protein